MQSPSLPLDEAVVNVVNDLIDSRGPYKLMKRKNVAAAVAKGVFNLSFGNGIILPEIIKLSKAWLRKNVFTASEILKQTDIRGGMLNYEGIGVLNDVEAAAECFEGLRRMGRLLPTPASLQHQQIFNKTILGDEDGPAQWTLPMDENGKNVGIICLDNNRI
jgi:hypothetical protein